MTEFGYSFSKEWFEGPCHQASYGPYSIVKAVSDNAFQLNLQPYLGMHPVFNIDLLKLYCPSLFESKPKVSVLTDLDPEHFSTYHLIWEFIQSSTLIYWSSIFHHCLNQNLMFQCPLPTDLDPEHLAPAQNAHIINQLLKSTQQKDNALFRIVWAKKYLYQAKQYWVYPWTMESSVSSVVPWRNWVHCFSRRNKWSEHNPIGSSFIFPHSVVFVEWNVSPLSPIKLLTLLKL